ncbi:hypothetical protein GUJ93_ZPchr0008g12143 [Zizania palustris]|uniref:Uncharacterized protein n=1 Tax=Zizania palustris TaxID=103762 RepID=A0A8J5V1S3_ZIZPA|nr:hypothetical protein GUJ93_ZPchr0008g12143 [Zizania palustris]
MYGLFVELSHRLVSISSVWQVLQALKGLVQLQATMRGRQVRKQAAMMLRCMQARIWAHRVRMSTEGHTMQKLLEAHHTKLDTLRKPSFALNVLTFLAFAQQQQKPNSYCRLNQSGILLKHEHFDKSNGNWSLGTDAEYKEDD